MNDTLENSQSFPQTRSRLNSWSRLFVLLGMLYLGVIGVLSSLQRKLIYVPTKGAVSIADAGRLKGQLQNIQITTHDDLTLNGWLAIPRSSEGIQDRRLVILFPGNGGNRLHRAALLRQLTDLGCHALIVDYRGYAENPGSPTEEAIAKDVRAVVAYANQKLKFLNRDIIICGQSLGGGVATRLTAELCQQKQPPAGLILRATFSSLVDAASYHYPFLPIKMTLVDRYPSINRIPEVTCPILCLHGKRDRIVPFKLGKKLFDAAPDQSASGIVKVFLELPQSGHNDIHITAHKEVTQALQEFLERIK